MLNFPPPHTHGRRGGTGGRRLHRDSPRAPVGRLGLARGVQAGKSGRGGGERPALPAGSSRAGSGLISNRGLDCSWTVTLPRPAHWPARPGPGVSLWHPPQRGVRTD